MSAVSVCVSTYNRAELLPRLVAALQAQTLQDFELIIVDDASTDDTAGVLAQWPWITVIRLERNGGPAVGRNAAWRAATSTVVAFTDDDCEPTPEWLAAAVPVAVPGCYVVGQTQPAPDQLDREGPFSRTLRITNAKYMQTCNVFYQRADLERLGGFDERMRTAEDTDLGFRALEAGIAGVYAPDALVHHDVRRSSLAAALRDATRWVDVPWVVKRHGRSEYQTWRYFWKVSHARAFVAVVSVIVGLMLGAVLTPWWLLVAIAGLGQWAWRNLTVERKRFSWPVRLAALPGSLLVDLTEMCTMVRGSVRHRILLL